MHFEVKFLNDFDDSYEAIVDSGIELRFCPDIGACVYLNSYYHRVIDVIHEVEDDTISLHLGKSAQTALECREADWDEGL